MQTPTHVTEEAATHARSTRADCIISVGGGSTTGLGKAISLRTGLPHIAIPTTYAGSEMTAILRQTANKLKTTLVDPVVIPRTVIYDPNLTVTLPVMLSATSGLNSMAHAGQ
jgi:alcohol dehydrogenase class IV